MATVGTGAPVAGGLGPPARRAQRAIGRVSRSGRFVRYFARRMAFVIPQILGITIITFLLIRLLPGDPARLVAGPLASDEAIESLRADMGMNDSIFTQYWTYITNALHGDLGYSWYTGNPVREDIVTRLPATLELISYALVFCVVLMIPLGVFAAMSRGLVRNRLARTADRGVTNYGLFAGAVPDFWLGLILIFVFFTQLAWLPEPVGRLGVMGTPPTDITGFYAVDGLITGNWSAFGGAVSHLALPVATLVLVYGAAVLKMTQSTVAGVLDTQMIAAGRLFGLPRTTLARYTIRNALPPIVTITGVVYGYLLGGAVLVETIFGWGGIGQYAVQAVVQNDYAAVQGFVLVASVFSLIVYLIVDLLYFALDPRMRPGGRRS